MTLPISRIETLYNWLKNQKGRPPHQRPQTQEKKEEPKKLPADGHIVDEYA